ncbi:DUF1223 domain-containing protein [Parasedimentitalea huanghaiensis]|uniref:DUF1223 domain-containing protein n=1 Tax=Parasedimentitalea huanghaiensis TaxID=2682100 RepID=A0A6L6WE64_9RHOB|nr:DUF1223 domain-containing protein [Zongyanglinia huanghaiensis]MVO14855.1 DUF1223 domain-containing protein [Zongyanglinia huanghaiensis]
MRVWKTIVAAICIGLPVPAIAQSGPVVVELFTSQGCSSCPPADRLLHRLTEREDVLPLALHVDYWDYIGWADQFARPVHTQRQKGYAHAGGRKMIYTPQMVIMGQDDVVGADAMELAEVIAKHQQVAPLVRLDVKRAEGAFLLRLQPLATMPVEQLTVQLVRFDPVKTIEITRGELSGSRFEYANVVEDWQQITTWNGQDALSLKVPFVGIQPAAVLVQRGTYGAILAAARIE